MSEYVTVIGWSPYDLCPCPDEACAVQGHKLTKYGHAIGCACRSCIGRRANRKGHANQAKGHRALGGEGFTPRDEESAPAYRVEVVQVEHKGGGQIPASWGKFISTDWFRRALGQADRARRIGEGSNPAVMINGRWLVVDCKRAGKDGAA